MSLGLCVCSSLYQHEFIFFFFLAIVFKLRLLLQHTSKQTGLQAVEQPTPSGMCTDKVYCDLENGLDGYRPCKKTNVQSTEHKEQG